jgi:hypothetical protein
MRKLVMGLRPRAPFFIPPRQIDSYNPPFSISPTWKIIIAYMLQRDPQTTSQKPKNGPKWRGRAYNFPHTVYTILLAVINRYTIRELVNTSLNIN